MNLSVDWQRARQESPSLPPALKRAAPGTKRGRFDILIPIGATDPDSPVPDGQRSVPFYSVLEIKSTEFDGRTLGSVRRIISRHRQQIVKYIGTMADLSTQERATYPEATIAPGVVYPAAPGDIVVRQIVEEYFAEECIAVVWFDEQ